MGIFDKLRNKKNVQVETPSATHYDSVSGIPFPAYKGKEPYMFISYAHVDSPAVYPIISEFNDMGYNVWYDEGIEPGIEWPEEIANALDRCSLFVVFITPAAAGSLNVRNEINFALSKKLPFIAIYTKNTALTPGLQLQMGSKQAILKYNMDDESFRRKYTYSFETVLKPAVKRTVTPTQCHLNSSTKKELEKVFTGSIAFFPEEDFEIDHGLLRKYHGNGIEVKLPESVQIIGGFAFHNCRNLESIVMSDECGAILDNAFISCPRLTNITIGKSFSSLSEGAFVDCPNVRFSYYKDRMPEKFDRLFPDKSIVSEIDELYQK
ncbi:MAG TPA: TIR domain-containing protein [Bacillota bacterium]|nr:TIR domain-containing protein [Bacillota bacterium]HPL54470.1 TIR domain-containing protein [Bacillota bacterium]